ncbi:MAG: CRISPR-associated endonuclease Cas1 [Anaerolineae bacterium]|nr:CRISPR-associated endonuclease Cas1 [Anaerolineae bacterium]
MPPLYLIEQGAKLHHDGRRLIVSKDDRELSSTPLAHVSEIVIMGNVGLTTPTIKLLLAENIDVVFLTIDGEYRGRLVGVATPHVLLRRKQYRCQDDATFVLAMAQRMVSGKIANARVLLQRHNRERHDPEIAAAIEALHIAYERVPRTTTLNSLNGVEGAATAAYFGAWKRLLKDDWKFEKRVRRPPTDPINVLLSFGYTLLARAAHSAVEAVGLDPYAGFLHGVEYNRPSLALDLMEEFRCVVDGVIQWLGNSAQIQPSDFMPGDAARPIVMNDSAKRKFIQAYENRMNEMIIHPRQNERLSLRRCILAQARCIVDCIQRQSPDYTPMLFR